MELILSGVRCGVVAASTIITLMIAFVLFAPLVGAICSAMDKLANLFGGRRRHGRK